MHIILGSSFILLYNQKRFETLREWVLLKDINFFNGQYKRMTNLMWNFQKKNKSIIGKCTVGESKYEEIR